MKTFRDDLLIGGRFRRAAGRRTAVIVNPATEEKIGQVPSATIEEVDAAVAAARTAFDEGGWPRWTPAQRAAAMTELADRLEARAAELAELTVAETGTPVALAQGYAAAMPPVNLRYYAAKAETYPFEGERVGPMGRSLVLREAVGVVAAIPPWNGPLALGTQKLAPALIAGCTAVFKAPIQDPLACYLFAEEVAASGIPEGVISVLVADAAESEHLVGHPGVDKVSFTGSTAIGQRIAEVCSRNLTRLTLELGGKSAAVVLEDADPATVAPALLGCSIGMHQGEICTAQTRLVLPRSRYAEYLDLLAAGIEGMTIGDPADPGTVIGPMISAAHRDRVEGWIERGVAEGARIVIGGGRPDHARGWYVRPTLLADVTNDMAVAREEIFGPVVVAIPHDGEEDAIRIANDSSYGLSGTVWTADDAAGLRVARAVRTGTFCGNTYTVDIDSPFGGFKKSGYGREMATEGLDAYTELKSVALSGAGLN